MTTLAAVLGVGASSPFGLDARQCALFVRAKKLAPRPVSFPETGGITMGSVRSLAIDDSVVGVERMLRHAAPALREAVRDAGIAETQSVRVFVALPESTRPLPEAEAAGLASASFLAELERRSGCLVDHLGSEALRLGHAGFAVLLERALAHVGKGPVIVGGVDTYHHPAILRWLDGEKRLLGEVIHNGFVPSEGAAFVVFGAAKQAKPVSAVVSFARGGLEVLPPGAPRIGELMTDLVRLAGASVPKAPIPWVLPDVNGERHRTKEWSFASLRNRELIDSGATIEDHLYDEMGDVGAATGAAYAAYAITGFRTGFAPARSSLIALASDGDERGVVLLEAAT